LNLKQNSYRADIDGLRAIAVLGVLIFHANLGILGGFVGVDVFFVISGYLISSLIIKELNNGTFSIVKFWERRIRRIFPALAFVVLFCMVAGWFLLLPFGYLVLAQSTIALSCFASNIQFWRTISYWSPGGEENPLLHTWSLSVEEQFYLIFPLLVACLYRFKRGFFVPAVIALGVLVSFTVSIFWLRADPSGAFYLLPSRAWELGLGVLVSFLPSLQKILLQEFISILGLVAILGSFFLLDSENSFPGVAALPSVMGAAMVVWSGNPNSSGHMPLVARALSIKPFVAIGLISYSLYLWHWPFFAFYSYLFGQPASKPLSIFFLGLAFLISYLSWKFIEQPFRKQQIAYTAKSLFCVFLLFYSFIIFFCLLIYINNGLSFRVPKSALDYDRVLGNEKFVPRTKKELPGDAQLIEFGVSDKKPEILVWGDSHAEVMLHSFDNVSKQVGISGIAIKRAGAPPTFGWSSKPDSSFEHRDLLKVGEYIEKLIDNGEIKTVFLIFRWSFYFRRNPALNLTQTPTRGFEEAFAKTVETFKRRGLRVVVFEEVPIFPMHIAKSMALNEWIGTPKPKLSILEHLEFRQQYELVICKIKEQNPSVIFFDPSPAIYQDGSVDYISADGFLYYRDTDHWTPKAVKKLEPAIRNILEKNERDSI